MLTNTDLLLERLVEESRANLQNVRLWAVGRPYVWVSLATRFGAGVEYLSVPLLASNPAVHRAIDTTYHLWTNLRWIEFRVGPNSASLLPVLGLGAAPNLEGLIIHLGNTANNSFATTIVEQVAGCIPLCRKLRKLALDATDLTWVNVSPCVMAAASSRSLQELDLTSVRLDRPEVQAMVPTNTTLRTLYFTQSASLDEYACTLLSHFQGLHVLTVDPPSIALPKHRSPGVWYRLLGQLPELHTLELRAPSDIVDDAVLRDLANALRHHPAMRYLALSVAGDDDPLNSLTTLLQSCQGTLDLNLRDPSSDNLMALSRGIGSAHPEVDLSCALPLEWLTALFVALRGNASCQFFSLKHRGRVGDFDNDAHSAALEGALSNLLARNSTLTALQVDLGYYTRECDLNVRMLNSLLDGLVANGSVQMFDFRLRLDVSPAVSRRVVQMLDGNASLRKFDGICVQLTDIGMRFVVT